MNRFTPAHAPRASNPPEDSEHQSAHLRIVLLFLTGCNLILTGFYCLSGLDYLLLLGLSATMSVGMLLAWSRLDGASLSKTQAAWGTGILTSAMFLQLLLHFSRFESPTQPTLLTLFCVVSGIILRTRNQLALFLLSGNLLFLIFASSPEIVWSQLLLVQILAAIFATMIFVLKTGLLVELTELTRKTHEQSEALQEVLQLAQRREAHLSMINDVLSIGLFQTNEQGRLVFINSTCAELLNAPPKQWLNRDWSEMFADHSRQAIREQFERAVQLGTPICATVKLTEKFRASEPIWVNFNIRQITTGAGGYVGTLENLNSQLQTIALLTDSDLAARNARKTKEAYLGKISHELRTPMTSISGYAEVLEQQLKQLPIPLPGTIPNALDVIQRNSEYLLRLINDLLDYEKIEAGKFELEILSSSPQQIAAEVCALLQIKADEKQLNLSLHLDESVPTQIQTDPTRLRQILINLIGNAVKFTEEGSVRVNLRTQTDESGESLEFEIVDTGVGMTAAQLEKLFEEYSQADASTSRKFGGTGLGLAISRRLTRLLGGEIDVTSEPGHGSAFSLKIPMSYPRETPPARSPAAPFQHSEQRPVTERRVDPLISEAGMPVSRKREERELPYRILLAEDSPDTQRLIIFLLEQKGASVTLAENGEIAVQQALASEENGTPFDLVLMDMMMPVLSGIEATEVLVSEKYPRPIVAMTANALPKDHTSCLEAGCCGVLTKPIHRRVFFDTIHSVIDETRNARSSSHESL